MKVALLAKPGSDAAMEAAGAVRVWLLERGHEVLLDDRTAGHLGLPSGYDRDHFAVDGVGLAVALGGDGTQLLAGRVFGPSSVPIFGVNMGRLGFLTDTEPDRMLEVLEQVLRGDRTIQARMMLQGEVRRGDEVLGPVTAFNDLVVSKGALAQVIRLETRVNGSFVNSYLADGIIFSTPTGSTAYGLAVGGPIIEPSTDVMLVAPICPHMLTNRPLIVGGNSLIECTILESRGEIYLTIDGQEGFPLRTGDVLHVQRSPHRAQLVQAASRDFYAVLRQKMGWGTT
jgi:NAD+ kinase